MVKAVIEGGGYPWPCGVYVDSDEAGFHNIMMAMETTIDHDGIHWKMPTGTEDEMAALLASYGHLVKLRDEVIEMGLLPATSEWSKVNPALAGELVSG